MNTTSHRPNRHARRGAAIVRALAGFALAVALAGLAYHEAVRRVIAEALENSENSIAEFDTESLFDRDRTLDAEQLNGLTPGQEEVVEWHD